MSDEFNNFLTKVEIIERASQAAVEVLKEIYPDIRTFKYEKGDEYFTMKERLCLGICLELAFLESHKRREHEAKQKDSLDNYHGETE